MAQKYPPGGKAHENMAIGMCPECGLPPASHRYWDYANCSLTPWSVRVRIEQYRADLQPPSLTEELTSDKALAAFRKAWEAADAEGDHGNRVRRGIVAAIETIEEASR